jgi:hypothetical protein
MTSKADFTDEEWTRLKRAPFIAGMAISLADPGGPIEAVKETAATLKTVKEAAESRGPDDLAGALARETLEEARQRKSPLKDFKAKGSTAGVQILDELRDVNGILSEKADPAEADAVREWLLEAAKEASEAAKEGGFMGFRAERVSEGEQRMLDKLREVLAAPA